MVNDIWKNIEVFIKDTLSLTTEYLDIESIEFIEHYLKYDEYEMAFEALFIEIIKMKHLPTIDFNKSLEIAMHLKLNEESIFEPDFWNKFEKYTLNNIKYY